ncbi:thiol-disulfide oxidoreductase ResA [Halalkalibacter nanhaiisediminis]|uniref:Peroxiredoxin n=1 Tax=Halalkalibacter nanhaiisediminis TaxID=688079 RepID=A0A562QD57_9BACI|nr:thiol-disulfide oxidoreductase ResA [Halalkalibacter nanhaiisediminis]TWI54639.1 peroxiredoxin [Halalkalibacter nanhaiisediminis]
MKQKRLIMRTSILAVIALALGYTFYSNFFADRSVAQAGNDAVNFVLNDLEGERIELSDLQGKGVFLNFWGTYCPPCEKEMPYMENLYAEYKEKGVEIIAVNVNEPELTVERFVNRYSLTFPVVIDKGMNVSDAYGISPLPTTVLIDEHGTIVHVHTGGMTEAMVRDFMERIKPVT